MFKSNITSNNIQNKYILPKAYYEKILIPRFQKARWTIYCYKENDYTVARKFFYEKKLDGNAVYWNNSSLKERNKEFI